MTYNSAIDCLIQDKNYIKRHTLLTDHQLSEFDVAIGVLEEKVRALQTADIPKWIACSERLPMEDNYYLTTIIHAYSDCDDYSNVCKMMFYDGEWQTDLKIYKVTAWTPMPEPYL